MQHTVSIPKRALDVPRIAIELAMRDDGNYADLIVYGLPPDGEPCRFSCLDTDDGTSQIWKSAVERSQLVLMPAGRTPQARKNRTSAGRPDIDMFKAAMMREERSKGFFVSFEWCFSLGGSTASSCRLRHEKY
jgi:hypothetical protein